MLTDSVEVYDTYACGDSKSLLHPVRSIEISIGGKIVTCVPPVDRHSSVEYLSLLTAYIHGYVAVDAMVCVLEGSGKELRAFLAATVTGGSVKYISKDAIEEVIRNINIVQTYKPSKTLAPVLRDICSKYGLLKRRIKTERARGLIDSHTIDLLIQNVSVDIHKSIRGCGIALTDEEKDLVSSTHS